MTPEERIFHTKIILGVPTEYNARYSEDYIKIKEIFGSSSEFRKASRIFWKYHTQPALWNKGSMSYDRLLLVMSPTTDTLPVVQAEEWELYKNYRLFLKKEKYCLK
jgi:hypothetical protein